MSPSICNQTIRIGYVNEETILPRQCVQTTGECFLPTFQLKLITLVFDTLGCSYTRHQVDVFGDYHNGTGWDGAVRALLDNKIDITYPGFLPDITRLQVVDLTPVAVDNFYIGFLFNIKAMVKTVDYRWWTVLPLRHFTSVICVILIVSLFPRRVALKHNWLIVMMTSLVAYSQMWFGNAVLNSLYYTWRFPFQNQQEAIDITLSGQFKLVFTKSSAVKNIMYTRAAQAIGVDKDDLPKSLDLATSREVTETIQNRPDHLFIGNYRYVRLIAHSDTKHLVPKDEKEKLNSWFTTSLLRKNSSLKQPVTNVYKRILESGIDWYWRRQFDRRYKNLDVKRFDKLESNAISLEELKVFFPAVLVPQLLFAVFSIVYYRYFAYPETRTI